LASLELAHLAVLYAVACPVEFVLGANVDDELVGQSVDPDLAASRRRRLTQGVDALAIGLGSAGVGTVMAERLDSAYGGLEQGKVVVLHHGLHAEGQFNDFNRAFSADVATG